MDVDLGGDPGAFIMMLSKLYKPIEFRVIACLFSLLVMSDEPVTGLNGPIDAAVQQDMNEFAEIHLRLIRRSDLLKKRSRHAMFFKNWQSRICRLTIVDYSTEEDERENWKLVLTYFTKSGDLKGDTLVAGVYPIDFW